MRPLTLRRLFLQCLILGVILFIVVIVALKVGAVKVSLFALARDLIRVLVNHGGEIRSDYGLIVLDIRLPRFRRCCATHWRIHMCWGFRAARRWARFWR